MRSLEEGEAVGELGGEVGSLMFQYHATPCDVSGILRPHARQELLPHRRAGAIRTHQQVADFFPASLEPGRHLVVGRLEPGQLDADVIVVVAEGGTQLSNAGEVPTLIAEPGAGQSMTQAARDALRKVDSVLSENSEPLKDTIANFKIFSEGLARNTGKLDSILAGVEKMTGGGTPPQKITYDLRAAQGFAAPNKVIKGQLAIPEPSAVAMLETQRMLFSPVKDYPDFAEFVWADSIPKLLQARLIESFENYDIAHAPLRTADIGQADFQLLIDVRRFQIAVDSQPAVQIGLSARIVDKNGKVVASHLFEQSQTFDKVEPPAAVAAFNDAFGRIAKDMIAWTVQAL